MKKSLVWLLAVIITLSAAVYQRKTGPTHPQYFNVSYNNQSYKIKIERTHLTSKDAVVKLPVYDTAIYASLYYRIYPSDDAFTRIDFVQENQVKKAVLPSMPSAGKIEYYVAMEANNEVIFTGKDKPAVTRFRNDVPAYILVPHIFFMFFAMLFSSLTGLFILFGIDNYKKYMITTLILLFVGGFILGPVVQKFAFGEYWTGFPFGYDLTDNKTLIAFIFWLSAFIFNVRKKRQALIVTASLVLLLVFSIPHSLWGSQLDNKTGKIETGRQ